MSPPHSTKQNLAASLKTLMEEEDFSRISVSRICARCGLSRKTLYYHFRDKYDLLNWIFDTEFAAPAREKEYPDGYSFLADTCRYFYANCLFYRKALRIEGQNSFRAHFQKTMLALAAERFSRLAPSQPPSALHSGFLAEITTAAIQHWLADKNALPPETFLEAFLSCTRYLSATLCRDPLPDPADGPGPHFPERG